MRTSVAVVLTSALLLGGCASSNQTVDSVGLDIPDEAVTWPVGSYSYTGRLESRGSRPSSTTGTPARQSVEGSLLVASDGSVKLYGTAGSCRERATKKANARLFQCGDTNLTFATDGEVIRGWVTMEAYVQVGSEGTRCQSWSTDPEGKRVCITWERIPAPTRKTTISGALQVMPAGG